MLTPSQTNRFELLATKGALLKWFLHKTVYLGNRLEGLFNHYHGVVK